LVQVLDDRSGQERVEELELRVSLLERPWKKRAPNRLHYYDVLGY
jgi:hypothetical protein